MHEEIACSSQFGILFYDLIDFKQFSSKKEFLFQYNWMVTEMYFFISLGLIYSQFDQGTNIDKCLYFLQSLARILSTMFIQCYSTPYYKSETWFSFNWEG